MDIDATIAKLEADRTALVTLARDERRAFTAEEALRLCRIHDRLRDAEIERAARDANAAPRPRETVESVLLRGLDRFAQR